MIQHILDFFERQAFGVCASIGEKLGIPSHRIRLAFIYLAFLTFGSPIIIYLILAFLLEQRQYFRLKKRSSVWDL